MSSPPDATTSDARPSPRRRRLARRAAIAIALFLIALIPMSPVLLAGRMPNTHESGRYDILTMLFRDAIAHGYWYPRWLPELSGGYGYPTFLFYQPFFFYVASLCSLVPGLPDATLPYVAAGVFALVGAGGAYALARPIVRGDGVALACAAMFVMTPYFFVNLYVRGDHSEAAAMMCGPWPLALLMAAERRRHAGRPAFAMAAGAAVALAVAITTHPAFALIYVPLLGAIAATRTLAFRGRAARLRWLATLVAVVAAAAAIASPHWVSALQNTSSVHLDRALINQYRPEVNLFPPSRLISNRWGYDWIDQPATPTSAPISVQLGLPLTVLAIAGAWVGRRRPWVAPAAAGCALLVVAMTPVAAPFWALSFNPLRRIQFPWRLLAIIAGVQLLPLCHALAWPARRRAAPIAWAIVVATFAWHHAMFRLAPPDVTRAIDGTRHDFSWRDASDFFRQVRNDLVANGYAFAAAREFDPIWSQLTPAPRDGLPIVATRAASRELPGSDAYRIDVELTSPVPDAAVIRQFYFPGWRVEVNGVDVPDATLRENVTAEGLMVVPVPRGTSRLTAWFDGPPFWLPRTALALAVLVGSVAWLRRLDRDAAARLTSAARPSPGTAPAP